MSNSLQNNNADVLETLPSDKIQPSSDELNIINSLFKKKESKIKLILYSFKDIFIAGFLFIILSLPQVNTLLSNIFPSVKNSIYLSLVIKTIIFMVIYYIIINLNYVKKK